MTVTAPPLPPTQGLYDDDMGPVVTFDKNSLTTGIGGVEVTGFGGKITLTNTLSSRLYLAFETQRPKLRTALFSS